MKLYCLFFIALLFLSALCSCKKEVNYENNTTLAQIINQEETNTLNMNDVHQLYGTLIGIEDVYNPEDIEHINDDDIAPAGVHLIFKLNQQDTGQTVCVSVTITNSIGIDGSKIWKTADTNDDTFFPVGTDAVIEYYGELEDVSDNINYCNIYNPSYGVYDDKIVYKINYIKSIAKVSADYDN